MTQVSTFTDNKKTLLSLGPGAYNIPSTIGVGSLYKALPAYTFGLRLGDLEHDRSVGPCYFPHCLFLSNKPNAPHYSMTCRRNMYKTAPFLVPHKE